MSLLSFSQETSGSEGSTPTWILVIIFCGASMVFALAYLYTAELVPTAVRNVAVGAASTFARIGSMSAPYIVDLLGKVRNLE